jgi:hypothetical protein
MKWLIDTKDLIPATPAGVQVYKGLEASKRLYVVNWPIDKWAGRKVFTSEKERERFLKRRRDYNRDYNKRL